MLILQTTPSVPFAITTPWLQQIADQFLAAAAGDAAAAKLVRDNALQTDAQWNAAHPAPTPGTFDYARNAYRAAYASLQGLGLFAQPQPAPAVVGAPTAPAVTGAPMGTAAMNGTWKTYLVWVVAIVAGIWLLRKLA